MLKVINKNPFGLVYTGDVVDVMDMETGEIYPNGIVGSSWIDETGIHEGREVAYVRFPADDTCCIATL